MMAESWVNLKKLVGKDLELAQSYDSEADENLAWKITSDDLKKRMAESSISLVDDGDVLKIP